VSAAKGSRRGSSAVEFRPKSTREALIVSELAISRGTLMVVPRTLLKHWKEQFVKAVDENYLPPKWLLVDSDGKRNANDLSAGTGWEDLPSAAELAKFVVVLVTTDRLSREESVHGSTSPLLGVRWLRVVQDEGHSRGTGTLTSTGNMMNALSADSRLLMTGTPLKGDNADRWLKQLYHLLKFIRDPSASGGEKAFTDEMITPLRKYTSHYEIVLRKLEEVVRRTVLHHDKSLLDKLARPNHIVYTLKPSPDEAKSYNTLVSFALTNVLLTLMPGDGSGNGWNLSLLHPDNSRSLAEMVHNLLQAE